MDKEIYQPGMLDYSARRNSSLSLGYKRKYVGRHERQESFGTLRFILSIFDIRTYLYKGLHERARK